MGTLFGGLGATRAGLAVKRRTAGVQDFAIVRVDPPGRGAATPAAARGGGGGGSGGPKEGGKAPTRGLSSMWPLGASSKPKPLLSSLDESEHREGTGSTAAAAPDRADAAGVNKGVGGGGSGTLAPETGAATDPAPTASAAVSGEYDDPDEAEKAAERARRKAEKAARLEAILSEGDDDHGSGGGGGGGDCGVGDANGSVVAAVAAGLAAAHGQSADDVWAEAGAGAGAAGAGAAGAGGTVQEESTELRAKAASSSVYFMHNPFSKAKPSPPAPAAPASGGSAGGPKAGEAASEGAEGAEGAGAPAGGDEGVGAGLSVVLCVSGWLGDEGDFERPWGTEPAGLKLRERILRSLLLPAFADQPPGGGDLVVA